MSKKRRHTPPVKKPIQREPEQATDEDMKPDWEHPCDNCGQVPTVPLTGLCGPCTFGEADTIGGNW